MTDIAVLQSLVIELLSRIDDLTAQNALLVAENTELRNRLNLNSGNSHKPPSSDGLQKQPALPKPKGNKTGGQLGHQGNTLLQVVNPDAIIVHHAPCCPCCNKLFEAQDVQHIIGKRQVFDIPPPRLVVTEHQIGLIECCGTHHRGTFPDTVTQSVQYGVKIKALSVLLNTDYKIPFDKIAQLFGDLYHCSFNESTAISANKACFTALAQAEQQIQSAVLDSTVAHFDETGMRVQGKLHWFHTACTVLFTYLFVHTHRGHKALYAEESLLPQFKNWAVHDCWKSYFEFSDCRHAICNAHILRELQQLKEQQSNWATQMHAFLLELFHLTQKATVVLADQDQWVKKYQLVCQSADKEEPPPIHGKRGRPKNTKGRNLLNRLVEYQDGVLAFAFHQAVPFTNNQAERDIRCLKTKQKVATSFRTFQGAKEYARAQSVISTLRKHKMNVFENLIRLLNKEQVIFQIT